MRKRSGQTLAATMVVLVIIVLLAVVFMTGSVTGNRESSRPDGKGTTIPGAAMYAAKDDACRANLGQVRAALEVAGSYSGDDQPVQSLNELNIPESSRQCAVGKEPYVYDPATGTVKCPHPGHEKY